MSTQEAWRPLVKAPVIAELLDVSEASVYRMAADGTIPSYKLGGAVRFDPVAVLEHAKREVDE